MKKDPFRIFNVNEFKKWMEDSNQDPQNNNLIGMTATSKVNLKRLKSVSENLDSTGAVQEFYRNGGKIIEDIDNVLTIKTNRGSLRIKRIYTLIN